MNINFFDNADDAPRMREDVRIEAMRLEVSPEGRRLGIAIRLTPFIERPTIELILVNEVGQRAGLLTIIETLDRENTVVMHMRDKEPTENYRLYVMVYYASVDDNMQRQPVDKTQVDFAAQAGKVFEIEQDVTRS